MSSIRARIKDRIVNLVDVRVQHLLDGRTPPAATPANDVDRTPSVADLYAVQLRAIACEREGALPSVNIWRARIEDGHLSFSLEFQPLGDAPVRQVEFSSGQTLAVATFRDDGGWLKLEARLPASWESVEVLARLYSGRSYEICRIVPEYYRQLAHYAETHQEVAATVPTPPGDIVFLTQGHRDAALYEASVLTGIFHFREILKDVGRDPQRLRTILDLGCGTGRMLKGWYVDDPSRHLYGSDYNVDLIAWAKASFPRSVQFGVNQLMPPLSFESGKFDLIYMISVFTHLSLDTQLVWLKELKRVLCPGGVLVVTLHGLNWLDQVRRDRPQVLDAWIRDRYCEENLVADNEGSNWCGTLHLPDFAQRTLFRDWRVVGFYPGGRVRNHRAEGQFAHVQDVYVLEAT